MLAVVGSAAVEVVGGSPLVGVQQQFNRLHYPQPILTAGDPRRDTAEGSVGGDLGGA
jgi:hypothetical protein